MDIIKELGLLVKIYPEPIIVDGHEMEVFDNGGETFDRYTVTFSDSECLGLSSNPDSPMGFSQCSTYMPGPHLGKKISFNDLSIRVQNHIIARLDLQFEKLEGV